MKCDCSEYCLKAVFSTIAANLIIYCSSIRATQELYRFRVSNFSTMSNAARGCAIFKAFFCIV
jgi:hypothetical protein